MAGNWEKIGVIKRGQKGGNYMEISFDPRTGQKEVTLKAGQKLQIFDPRKSKFMTEERLAKLPDYIRFEVFVTPDKE